MVDVCGGDGPHIRDVVDDLKRMQSLQRSYNEMSEELTKKDRLLAENDAQADPLAGPQRGFCVIGRSTLFCNMTARVD